MATAGRRGTTVTAPGRGPAYQQVADELRRLIVDGVHAPGDRLPGEAELCEQFGVSRSTIREAIRTLEAQHLVVTTRGTTGGSFVVRPEVDRIEADLGLALGLLAAADRVSIDSIVEVRELLEAPCAAMAARRRTAEQLEELRELADHDDHELFHLALVDAAGNELVGAMTRPLLAVLRDRLDRGRAAEAFWDQVHDEHRRILAAVEAGDAVAAEVEMRAHLRSLTEEYRKIEVRDS